MDIEPFLKRKEELFKPIEQQIMMTDDDNDLLILGSSMAESAARIFINHYGVKQSQALIDAIFQNVVISIGSSTG